MKADEIKTKEDLVKQTELLCMDVQRLKFCWSVSSEANRAYSAFLKARGLEADFKIFDKEYRDPYTDNGSIQDRLDELIQTLQQIANSDMTDSNLLKQMAKTAIEERRG